MNLVFFAPAVVVVFVLIVWLGGKVSHGIRRWGERVARVLFDPLVSANTDRERRIESAYIETTYRTYAAKSLLYTVFGFVAGAIAGGYLIVGLLAIFEPLVQALAGLPRTMTAPLGIHPNYVFEISDSTRRLVIAGGGVAIGVVVAVLAYVLRWQVPASDAEVRRRAINEGMPRTAAFMYALSRGGMEFPEILRTLTEYRGVYGETANEMSITVREMDLFGRDMITALRRMSRRTPSEQFKTFSENLTSILQSGSNLSAFLEDQYERFQEEAETRQEDILQVLATLAEAYVTILVAGMLFLITILLVFGLTVTDTLWILQLLVYLVIPLGNAGFAVYLQQKLDLLGIARRSGKSILDQMTVATPTRSVPATSRRLPDGGLAQDADRENRQVLAQFDRVERIRRGLRNPLQTFLRAPPKVLWLTVPVATIALLVRAPAAFQADGVAVRMLDDFIIQSALFVLVTYGVVRQFYKRRIDKIEAAIPELLERLASLNEAGMSVVEGVGRVRGSDLGVLTPEVDRIWRDIEYGSNVSDALIRFGRRVRTTAITRVVMLLTNAMRASGNMGPVLRIASEQARAEVNLRRARRQQMFTYLVVIYVSFFVFLVIIMAVTEVLVPSLPAAVPTPGENQVNRLGTNVDAFSRFAEVNAASYTLIFFHAALLQALCAGLIAGQLGEGSLRDGVKHATVMLTIAYLVFVLLSAPVATLSITEATSAGDSVRIEGADLSDGGFIAVYDDADEGVNGTLLGHTEYLPPGPHDTVNSQTGIEIPLQYGEITDDTEIRIVVHRDTNGNEAFDFRGPYLPGTSQTDGPYHPVSDTGQFGEGVEVTYIGD
jgi:flagellar protein FlaJ